MSGYIVTYSTFRNNHICFDFYFQTSLNKYMDDICHIGAKQHLQPADMFPELREHVCWLHMSSIYLLSEV